ncbi:hypothetical protein L209DRAFT_492153 [Thermothelomyces heterothallicus CBS 203.75]
MKGGESSRHNMSRTRMLHLCQRQSAKNRTLPCRASNNNNHHHRHQQQQQQQHFEKQISCPHQPPPNLPQFPGISGYEH